MGQLGDALRAASHQIEARLHAHGGPMLRDGLSDALPQSWRFSTESEAAVLRIDAGGRIDVVNDVAEPPDVIVEWGQAPLVAALLEGRSNQAARPQPPMIRFPTAKGRKAFSLLGSSLGL
ncbi:MAG: hypothetical protein L3J91_00260 [Thermoplasmata archaeon]|nr:hypothetical protein [Thermoplasmata archaeon]